jgi:hypothetical protein
MLMTMATAGTLGYRKKVDETVPLFFQVEMPLQSSYWPTAFHTINKNPKECAQALADNPKSQAFVKELKTYWADLYDHISGFPPEVQSSFMLGYQETTADGHRGFFAGKVPIPDAHKLFESDAISRHMLQSFPQGAVVISPEWMEKMKDVDNKAEFVQQNLAEIEKDTKAHFAKKGALEGCGALLGGCSMVAVRGVHTFHVDGKLVQAMTVATLGQHPLDGVNLWMSSLDPMKPHEVLFSNALIGKHPVPFVLDFIWKEAHVDDVAHCHTLCRS